MKKIVHTLLVVALAACGASNARAAGTTPLALVQQFDNQGNGTPLSGCLLYFYVAGTVASTQQVFADFGLTQPLPNPVQCDRGARVPMHWLADGLIHVRLTDSSGTVQLDSTLQVLGPSSGGGGGGGGGGTVDPTAVAATGDIKARLAADVLTGWVILNGSTIGSATSGASQRANTDTQNLFVYLWQQCPNTHCPVPGGRGATALADFGANKQITLPDMRAKAFVGRDCMGTGCAGLLLSTDITSGGTDGVDTAGAQGQVSATASSSLSSFSQLPGGNFPVSGLSIHDPGHTHPSPAPGFDYALVATTSWSWGGGNGGGVSATTGNSGTNGTGISIPNIPGTNQQGFAASGGTGSTITSSSFKTGAQFLLSTFYMKL